MQLSLRQAVELYETSVFRAAFYICRNREDAEDVCQDTFLAYYRADAEFASEEHVKAWLLRTAINKARNVVRAFWRRKKENLDDYSDAAAVQPKEDNDLVREVLKLPDRCRTVIHLYYYEDYSVREIAGILGISENTVKSQLHRGRQLLKEKLQEEWENDEQ